MPHANVFELGLVEQARLDKIAPGRPTVGEEIERRTGVETRVSVLGYTQRGGSPTAHDRVLATRYGVYAADMVARKEWGQMAALQGNEIVSVPLADATRELKRVPSSFFEVAETFFG